MKINNILNERSNIEMDDLSGMQKFIMKRASQGSELNPKGSDETEMDIERLISMDLLNGAHGLTNTGKALMGAM